MIGIKWTAIIFPAKPLKHGVFDFTIIGHLKGHSGKKVAEELESES